MLVFHCLVRKQSEDTYLLDNLTSPSGLFESIIIVDTANYMRYYNPTEANNRVNKMSSCRDLLRTQIREFKLDTSDTWSPRKPTLAEQMSQLEYNACTDAYRHESITKTEVILAFGKDLYDEVALAAYEYEMDI